MLAAYPPYVRSVASFFESSANSYQLNGVPPCSTFEPFFLNCFISSFVLFVSHHRGAQYCNQPILMQDVAVKILMEQDFHPERFGEFMREVC
jgi:hypothetical protein